MSLPFKKEGSVAMPHDPIVRKPDDGSERDWVEMAAEELIHAVHEKDIKGVAAALRAAFEICDSEPHEEGPHV